MIPFGLGFYNGNGSSDPIDPSITSAATANNLEDTVLAHALTADQSGVTWTIVGGADQADFEISGTTLRWASNGVKDYEDPDDADTNNTYIVTVRVTHDVSLGWDEQTITITVTDDVADNGDARLQTYNDAYTTTFASLTNQGRTIDGLSGAQGYGFAPRVPEETLAKYYFEAQASDNSTYGLGVTTPGNTVLTVSTAVIGTTADTAGIPTWSNGDIRVEGAAAAASLGSIGTTRVCVAVDPVNQLLWMKKVGGNWNNNGSADPAAGTGGISISGLGTTTIIPVVQVNGGATGTISTYLRTADWTQVPPSGFGGFPTGRPGFVHSGAVVGVDNNTTLNIPFATQPESGGTIDAGDYLLLVLGSHVAGVSFTTPTGFASLGAAVTNGANFTTQLFHKIADGTETGNLTCTQSSAGSAGNCFAGQMTRFNNVLAAGPVEAYNAIARASASTHTGLGITALGTERLGVTVVALANDGLILADDGGNWTDMRHSTNTTTAGNDMQFGIYIADLTNGVAKAAFQENAMGGFVLANTYVLALIPNP